MRLLPTGVAEGLMVAAHRRTGRRHLHITVEAEAAGAEEGLVADTPEAVAVGTLAAVAVGTQVVADTPVVVAKNGWWMKTPPKFGRRFCLASRQSVFRNTRDAN